MTTAVTDKPIVALPPYNDFRVTQTGSVIDMAQAQAIAARVLELGAEHGFTREGRAPTEEEQRAFQEGRLVGYHTDKPRDRYDHLIHIYVRGPVEQAFEEAGVEIVFDADRRKVDLFLAEHRAAKAAAARVEHRRAFEGKVETFFADNPQSAAAERYIRSACVFGRRGARAPALSPMDWKDRLSRPTNPYGGNVQPDPPYQPEPSGYRLLTQQAVALTYSQEAYADHSTYLIPVVVEQPTDRDAAQRNLAKIARKLQTHNGWAGSGSTYGFSLHEEDDGCFVIMSVRASISD